MDWLTPTIAGASALGSAAIGGASTAVQNKRQLKYTKQLMDYQWQNYGSPMAQKAAYSAAGINPQAQQGIQASQPQANEMSTMQNPVMNALSIFTQFIPQITNMLSQSYQNDLITQQTEGTSLENMLKSYDLGEMKPLQKKQLEQIISNLEKTGQLTDKQISKVSQEIIKIMADTKGTNIDNLKKQLDYDWQKFKFDEGAPSVEMDILRNSESLQKLENEIKGYERNRAKREDSYDQAIFDSRKKFEIGYYHSLTQMQNAVEKFFSQGADSMANEFFGGTPEGKELAKFVTPIFRGLMYMLIIKMADMAPRP